MLTNVEHLAVVYFVGELHDTYKELACNTSLEIYFLLSHSDFSHNLRMASNERNSIALRRLAKETRSRGDENRAGRCS